jgi:hypothetical protein
MHEGGSPFRYLELEKRNYKLEAAIMSRKVDRGNTKRGQSRPRFQKIKLAEMTGFEPVKGF